MSYPSESQKSEILDLLAEIGDPSSVKYNQFYLAYQAILDDITTQDATGKEVPIPTVDVGAWLWLRGAVQVNQGQGAFSTWIRSYTNFQIENRLGPEAIPSLERMQEISNLIATDVIDDFLNNNNVPITLNLIGSKDAGNVVGSLFNDKNDYSSWSGVPLFIVMGSSKFFDDHILDSKNGTYDFASFLASAVASSGITFANSDWNTLVSAITDIVFTLTNGTGVVPTTTSLLQAFQDGEAKLNAYYNTDMFFPLYNHVLGKLYEADVIAGSSGNDFIHAGYGGASDTIQGSAGNDMIDSGDGADELIYTHRVNFYVSSNYTFADGLYALIYKDGSDGIDKVYNIERFSLGDGADIVHIAGPTTAIFQIDLGSGSAVDEINLAEFSTSEAVVQKDGHLLIGQISLSGAEVVNLTPYGDLYLIEGVIDQELLVDAGGNTSGLDVLDFSASTSNGIEVTVENGVLRIANSGVKFKNFERVIGSNGADTFSIGNAAIRYDGSDGADRFVFGKDVTGLSYVVNGGAHRDTLDLSLLNNLGTVKDEWGDSYNFIGNLASGEVRGGNGFLVNASLVENIDGSAYSDKISGNGLDNKISGNGGFDRLYGYAGDDELLGGEGNDYLLGGLGGDLLDGGEGVDKVSYIDSGVAVDIDLNRALQNGGEAAGDRLYSIEEVDGSNLADIIKLKSFGWGFSWGADGNDVIYGGSQENGLFDNLVYGDKGNDRFVYQAGHADFYGGTGWDAVDLSLSNLGYKLTINGFSANIVRNDAYYRQWIDARETETYLGSTGDDTFIIKGSPSNLILTGGEGHDILDFSYLNGVGVNLYTNIAQTNSLVKYATITGFEKIIGTSGTDYFVGSNIDAEFFGSGGNDTFYPGVGSEYFDGGSGHDIVNYGNSGAGVIVSIADNQPASGGLASGDILVNVEQIVGTSAVDWLFSSEHAPDSVILDGGGGDDTLMAFSGRATLLGGEGSDNLTATGRNSVINGGAGADEIYFSGSNGSAYGGSGLDTFFFFDDAKTGTIYDYEAGEDIYFGAATGNPHFEVNYLSQNSAVVVCDDTFFITVYGQVQNLHTFADLG